MRTNSGTEARETNQALQRLFSPSTKPTALSSNTKNEFGQPTGHRRDKTIEDIEDAILPTLPNRPSSSAENFNKVHI